MGMNNLEERLHEEKELQLETTEKEEEYKRVRH